MWVNKQKQAKNRGCWGPESPMQKDHRGTVPGCEAMCVNQQVRKSGGVKKREWRNEGWMSGNEWLCGWINEWDIGQMTRRYPPGPSSWTGELAADRQARAGNFPIVRSMNCLPFYLDRDSRVLDTQPSSSWPLLKAGGLKTWDADNLIPLLSPLIWADSPLLSHSHEKVLLTSWASLPASKVSPCLLALGKAHLGKSAF